MKKIIVHSHTERVSKNSKKIVKQQQKADYITNDSQGRKYVRLIYGFDGRKHLTLFYYINQTF